LRRSLGRFPKERKIALILDLFNTFAVTLLESRGLERPLRSKSQKGT